MERGAVPTGCREIYFACGLRPPGVESPEERSLFAPDADFWLLLSVSIPQFPRLDADGQMVLLGGQRAGGEGGKRARWIHRLVEVQNHLTVLRQVGVKETPGRIRFLARGQIAKDEKQLVARGDRVELALLPVERKLHVAWARLLLGVTQNVRHGNFLGRVVR